MFCPRITSQETGLGKCALHQKLVMALGTPQSRLADSSLYAKIPSFIQCVSETTLSVISLYLVYNLKFTCNFVLNSTYTVKIWTAFQGVFWRFKEKEMVERRAERFLSISQKWNGFFGYFLGKFSIWKWDMKMGTVFGIWELKKSHLGLINRGFEGIWANVPTR